MRIAVVLVLMSLGCAGGSPTNVVEKPVEKSDVEWAKKERQIADRETKVAERERKMALAEAALKRPTVKPAPVPPPMIEPKVEKTPVAKKPATFAEAIEILKRESSSLRAIGKTEYEERERLFTDKEQRRVFQLLSYKGGDLVFRVFHEDIRDLRSMKLNSLANSLIIDVAINDANAVAILNVVWDRSPKTRDAAFLQAKVNNWFWMGKGINGMEFGFREFFLERDSRVANQTPEMRKSLIDFAGEEAVLNSP